LARFAVLISLSVLGGCTTLAKDDVDGDRDAGQQLNAQRYLPVNDLPPPRDEPLISASEQDRFKAELMAAQRRALRASAKPK
jgi:hypothetical protein